MGLNTLPTETILHVLSYSDPNALDKLSQTSQRLKGIIRTYDGWLCGNFARKWEARLGPSHESAGGLLLPLLIKRWNRLQAIDALLCTMEGNSEQNRRGLELLCDYRDAVADDMSSPQSQRYRAFMAARTASHLTDLTTAIKFCSAVIMRLTQQSGALSARHVSPWVGTYRQAGSAEAVIRRGVEAVASALASQERGVAADDSWLWQQSSVMPLLMQERRWKDNLERIGVAPAGTAAGLVGAAQG